MTINSFHWDNPTFHWNNPFGDNSISVGKGKMFLEIADAITYINAQTKPTTIFDTATTACDADFPLNSKQVIFSSVSMASDTVDFDSVGDPAP